jgi:hypothetical protein
VWEDSDDEAITHEKTHQGQVVSASAREILQGGDAVVGVVGGDTPDEIDWKEQQNARARRLAREDKLPRVRDGKSNTPWTLERAVELCVMCEFRGKNNSVPYPADSEQQIAWWGKQESDGLAPRSHTILMNTVGCPAGTREHSPSINRMQSRGKTAQVAKKRKREGYEAVSRHQTGHDQKHSVEGVAIHLLHVFFRAVIPDFDCVWDLAPVFDGLEADFMMRRKDWDSDDIWVPMQMKSVSECIKGKQVNYNLSHGKYPHVFCVCVGLLGFEHRVTDVTGPNDIAHARGCSAGEIWNIGSCKEIEKSLMPRYGVPYSKLPANRRIHFPSAIEESKRIFAEALLRAIEKWPTRLARNRVLYEFSDTINSNVTENYKIEKRGFEVVDSALRTHGLRVDPVWRQNECVDYVVVSVNSGEPLVFVSGKTGTMANDDPEQRTFPLGGAPNKRFCDVVVACYSGAYQRVAVIRPDKAYVEGKKNFCWNEARLDPGVRIFDDIRKDKMGKAFVDYILSFHRL